MEEISESSLLVHVVDIRYNLVNCGWDLILLNTTIILYNVYIYFAAMFSHPLAEQQIDAVDKVLSELDVLSIPRLMVWNKV